ncbi:MAG: hypothetical protein V3T64_01070 [Myxococcota bacterium]
MQTLARLMIVLAAFMTFALAGCDGATPPQTGAAAESSGPERPAPSIESAFHAGTHARIRARADAAFAALDSNRRIRFESRIGPQPWPEDLPADWPRPDRAQVLADTRRDKLGRLLLVDLPDTPARALDSFREALLQHGFEARRPRSGDTGHALHVRRGELEAILTFIGRERTTRLEILFLCLQCG